MFYSFLLILVLCISSTLSQSCECGDKSFVDTLAKINRVDPSSHQFLDTFGRTRWFHGTNVVSKSFPYYPDIGSKEVCNVTSSSFCDEDMDNIQELGINLVRLGVMWPGGEPERGIYNCTYFCVIHDIIQSLASRGIYTLVDVHQDVLARQFCHEGVPDWFVKQEWVNESFRFPFPLQEPFTVDANGIPEPWDQCWTVSSNWFLNYFTVAVSDAFQRLYDNHDGLLTSFAEYWGKLAQEFKSYGSVLGYNLLNEPWAGNVFANPLLLIPGVADRQNLEVVWQNCSAEIRREDSETLVFYEGVTWDIVDGHLNVPGNDGSKAAMSYHYYAPPQLGLHFAFKNRVLDQERLGTGGILTEFRMWPGEEGEDGEKVMNEMKETIEAADTYLQSWVGWYYSSVNSRDVQIAKHYARTYAPAVAGFVDEMGFNENTADYFIIFTANTLIKAPTEVKINQRIYYPDGYTVEIIPTNSVTWEAIDERNLHFSYTDETVDKEKITIKIRHGQPSSISPTISSSTSTSSIISSTTGSSSQDSLRHNFNILVGIIIGWMFINL